LSERRLCEEVHLNLAYRWFCRLGLDGDVPDVPKRGNRMRNPTDDEIMRALCCGAECAVGPKNTGYCHRWDFSSEAARIRALLDRHGEVPTCMGRSSEPEEA